MWSLGGENWKPPMIIMRCSHTANLHVYKDVDKSPLDNGGIKCADFFKVLKKIFVISFFQSFMQFPSLDVTLPHVG